MQGAEGLPEVVYLITVDGEWPVSAFAEDHPSTADRVEVGVAHRMKDAPSRCIHVWKADLVNVREVDLMPATTIRAKIVERD